MIKGHLEFSQNIDENLLISSQSMQCDIRVAELCSLSSGAKMATKIFVKRVFTIFASNASFLRAIANLKNLLSEICNIHHVIVHLLPKKHCF